MIRLFSVWLHRWIGLLMAGFLVIVALTGSLLAFNSELERLISPQLYAAPRPGVAPLDLGALAERAEALAPEAYVTGLYVAEPGQVKVSVRPRKDPATGRPYVLGFDQLFLDPWTGDELGRRTRGDISQGWLNLMPFILKLHYALALNTTGAWVLGIVALAWTIDCFLAFYLTLPVAIAGFWERWKPAWLIKRRAGAFRLNFDLHRAGGLWVWPVLFIFAWSSVMFNLRPVYDWVTSAVLDYEAPALHVHGAATPYPIKTPRFDWRAAQATGQRLMAEQALNHGFAVEQTQGLRYSLESGMFTYSVRSSVDVTERAGGSSVVFDGDTGALQSLKLPTGQHSGNTVTTWLSALHQADVFGMPYRIFVCLLGIVITMLSATGIYIWWKKLRARKFSATRQGETADPEVLAAE